MVDPKQDNDKKQNPDVVQDPNAQGKGASSDKDAQKTVPIAALHEERDKRQKLSEQLEQMKGTVEQLKHQHLNQNSPYQAPMSPQPSVWGGQYNQVDYAQQPVQQAPPQQRQQSFQPRNPELWDSDPKRAAQQEIAKAMSWMDQTNRSLNSQVKEVSQKFEDFGDYEQDVREFLQNVPVRERARPGIAEVAYYIVKGKNSGKTAQQVQQQADAKRAAAGYGVGMPAGGGANPTDAGSENKGLSDDEKKVAAAMGLSEEDYLKSKR